jgi:hypothetical protein
MVSPEINARVLAATLRSAKLITLKSVGQMPHHAAPLSPCTTTTCPRPRTVRRPSEVLALRLANSELAIASQQLRYNRYRS